VSGAIADGLSEDCRFATEQGGAWQRNRVTGQALATRTRSQFEGNCSGSPPRLSIFALAFIGRRTNPTSKVFTCSSPLRPPAERRPYPQILRDMSRVGRSIPPSPSSSAIPADSKPGLDNSNEGVDLTANIDFGAAKLTSITAYNKLIRREYADWDATQFDDSDEYLNSDFNVFSQELRLASTGSGPLQWVAGVFYSDEDLHENFYSDLTDRLGGIAITTYEQVANSVGVFAQSSYQITDSFKATFGVREDHETRELKGLNTSFLPGVPSLREALWRFDHLEPASGKFELDYTPIAGTLIYGSISRGVKSGGFTAHQYLERAGGRPLRTGETPPRSKSARSPT